jgi:chromosome segregation ATPase
MNDTTNTIRDLETRLAYLINDHTEAEAKLREYEEKMAHLQKERDEAQAAVGPLAAAIASERTNHREKTERAGKMNGLLRQALTTTANFVNEGISTRADVRPDSVYWARATVVVDDAQALLKKP